MTVRYIIWITIRVQYGE